MSQEKVTHIIVLMCTAKNYTLNPKINQADVSFTRLRTALASILSTDDYDVCLQVPNYYLDLKATSDLQRRGSTGLHDHLMETKERLLDEPRGDRAVFPAVTAIELNNSLNDHHHCPAVFPLVLTSTPKNFLKWSNDRLTDGLKLGENTTNPTVGHMPNWCVDTLSAAFNGAVTFEQTFMFTPLDGVGFQEMLFQQLREELPEGKRDAFDQELTKLAKGQVSQAAG